MSLHPAIAPLFGAVALTLPLAGCSWDRPVTYGDVAIATVAFLGGALVVSQNRSEREYNNGYDNGFDDGYDRRQLTRARVVGIEKFDRYGDAFYVEARAQDVVNCTYIGDYVTDNRQKIPTFNCGAKPPRNRR